MNLLAPWGFYGSGNIGDQATLQGFGRLLAQTRQPVRVWAGSSNPRHTARVEPSFRYFRTPFNGWTRRWLNYRASGVVFAGGTPIMDCHGEWPLSELLPLIEEADSLGKPIVFAGVGTERLERAESRTIMARRIAPIVRYWTVRSEPDQERLIEYGVPPERILVAADMAWLLEPSSANWGREQLRSWGVSTSDRLIGVNVMDEKPVRDRHPHLFDTLACYLDRLVECEGTLILFLANDVNEAIGFDRSATLRTLAAMKHRDRAFLAPNIAWPPSKMMSLIANCHMAMSMRYHFCLFAAIQGVPFLALKRSDKVADLCWDLSWSFGTDLDDLSVQDMIVLSDALNDQRSATVSRLSAPIAALRERACLNAVAIEKLRER